VAAGAYIGGNMYKFIGGERAMKYLAGDLKAKGSGGEESFSGNAHAIHYDFLMHFAPTGAKIRPFVAAGGGVKIFLGTGAPSVSQPLERIVLLTHTHEVKGLGSVGPVSRPLSLSAPRYAWKSTTSSLPSRAKSSPPLPNGKISGLLHDIVFMGGIAITF